MNFWDSRYSGPDFAYGKEANDFLQAHAAVLPRGRVLCLADGEGRNSVFLAKLGYTVHAVDLSVVGLNKAASYAQAEGVPLTTEQADLSVWQSATGYWDGVVSIFAHLPSPARQALHVQVVKGLKPGGVLLLEAYTPRQLESGGLGGPSAEQKDFFMSLEALRPELTGLEFLLAQECERDLHEGAYHQGRSAVVQVIARKPPEG